MYNIVWDGAANSILPGDAGSRSGVFHRRPHEISTREAAAWSGGWIALSVAFGIGLSVWKGPEIGVQFFTGYILEKLQSP